MNTITVAPYRLNLDGSVSATGTAASAIDPQWTDVISETGSFSVTFKNTDPMLDNFGFDGRDLLQFLIDGEPAFVGVPDPAKIVTIAQGEDGDEMTTLSGPGMLALLDRMRVYPMGGVGRLPKEGTRYYNWTTLDVPASVSSQFVNSKEILDVGSAKAIWPWPWADDFPLDIAQVIWADNPGGNTSSYADADLGTCWFRYPFTPPEEGIYRWFLTSDNNAKWYMSSQLVAETDSFNTTAQVDVSLTADPQVIAVECFNGAWLPTILDAGPGGIAAALYLVTLVGLQLVTYTFSGYQVRAYEDDPPGVTPGYAYELFLNEGVARGVLPGLTWDFDAVNDTNGNPWDEVADISTSTNTPGLDFTRQLSATYMDVRFSPDLANDGLLLHAYRLGEMGTVTPTPSASSPNATWAGNVPANVLDGNLLTLWQPVGGLSSATLTVDRGPGTSTFSSVQSRWYPTFQAINYTIQTSTNGVSWTTVKTVTGNASDNVTDTFATTSHRYVRIVITSWPSDGADPYAHLALLEFTLGGGSGGPATLARGVNITTLEHQRENLPINAVLIEAADRWVEDVDTFSVSTHGRSESALDVGAPATLAEVYRIADGQLAAFAQPREEIDAGWHPLSVSETPYVAGGVQIGNLVTVPDSTGVSQPERLVGLTVTQDGRRAVFLGMFRDVVLGEDERLALMVRTG